MELDGKKIIITGCANGMGAATVRAYVKAGADVIGMDINDETGKNAILELMTQIDNYVPQPERPKDQPFLMPIEDVFSISGRGTVVTGRVERGVKI